VIEDGTRGIFVSSDVQIPTTIVSGVFSLIVQVEDKQGNRVQQNIQLTVGPQGSLGGSPPIFRDIRFVPSTAAPGEDVSLFVEVRDANGTDTVTVFADFTELRKSVEELDDLINFTSGAFEGQNTFSFDGLTLPDDLSLGVYDIPITVIDDTNNIVVSSARLRVERTGLDEGQAPQIDIARSFQVPRVFTNDESQEGELQILVHDPDSDVLTVITNFGSIGRANGASIRDDVGDVELLCNESRAVVCMKPAVLEGLGSRWFVLDDITIPITTIPSTDPYPIELIAIDAKGHTDRATFMVQIGDLDTTNVLRVPPEFLTIVPVDDDELELVVSAPLKTSSVDRGGSQLKIQPTLDAFAEIAVNRVSWDTTARYLYIQNDPLTPGETYTFSINTSVEQPLTDIYGNRFSSDKGGILIFQAAQLTGEAPAIESVNIVDPTHIDVLFTAQVIPSSVHPDLLSSRASLVSTVTGDSRAVRGGILINKARTLRLTVEKLREGDRYRLRITDVLAPGLIPAPSPGVEKIFIAVFPRGDASLGPLILPTADLNRDGAIDFTDFSLFSSVYGTEYDLQDIQLLRPGGNIDSRGSTPDTPSSTGIPSPFSGRIGDNNILGGPLPDISF